MPGSKVAVVILNWNGKRFLEKFLPYLISCNSAKAEIIVADNASSDDSLDFLQKKYPGILVIKNNENTGFAKGYNIALSQVDAEYYVLLNSDIEVTENWIEPVISLMDNDKDIAACQPKIRSYNEREKFEYAGAAGGFIDKYGYPFCQGRIFQELEVDKGQYEDVKEVFWATGACLFVRAELYRKYGGLDDDFFAHMEEIDFCWRMKNAGYKIMYCPRSVIYHVGGGTLPKKNPKKTYLNFRNNFILLYKNLPSSQLLKVFVLRLFLDGIAALKFLFEGHLRDFFAVMHAHFAFYFTFGKHRKKRKMIRQKKISGVYQRAIVFEHYLKKKKTFDQLNPADFS
ncbi:MAG: glycosyltransferase family 2 protein [Bacteroidota bacterium]